MHVENYVESMLKISVHVEICNACWKLCWKHVENFNVFENHVKYVYVNHVENQVENCVEVQIKTIQFNFLVDIYTIFWFGTYFKLQEVRNYVWKQSRIFNK